MKIKLPFTERFLWDIYKFFNNTGEIAEDILNVWTSTHPMRLKSILFTGQDYYAIRKKYKSKYGKQKTAQLISYLKRKGYIKTPELENKKGIIITPIGLEKILSVHKKTVKLPKRKDGKLQMVLFDISEDKKYKRNLFRIELINLGYRKLQKSVWISPYEVLEKTQSLIKDLGIFDEVRLLLVEKIVESNKPK
ncbi:MAG: hypothetical protein AAB593_01180 [Patescibacteria group bacterium]|mgnify:CR=1 FL=1